MSINANNTGISTYHLAENPQLYEPSRNNAFQFVITGIDQLLRAGISGDVATDKDYIQGPQDVIRLSVAEGFAPNFEVGVIDVRRGNSVMHFANVPNFNSGSIRCNDYVGARVKDTLLAWQALVYDVADDVVNLAHVYKHDCKLIEYMPDYSKVLRTWTLKGCWVTGLSEGNFSHEDHDKRLIDVSFVYDRAYPDIPNDEEPPKKKSGGGGLSQR